MDKRIIVLIVIVMSIALLGIAFTQFIWIKAQVDLDEKNFDDKVTMAMNSVKVRLTEDTEEPQFVTDFLRKKQKSSLFGTESNALSKMLTSQNNKLNRTIELAGNCLLYTSPSPRDQRGSRMPSSA